MTTADPLPATAGAAGIRPARDADMRACRLLMPETFFPSAAPEAFVAAGADGRLVGAGAVLWRPGGFSVQIHVAPPWRRRGIGRALMAAIDENCAGETERLNAWPLVAEDSPSGAFLRATGFEPTQRFFGFETDGQRFQTVIGTLRQRLERTKRIPSDARIIPLGDAPLAEVIPLVATAFNALPTMIAARIAAEGAAGYDRRNSVVLMVGCGVVGALLSSRHGDVAWVEVNAVLPEFRKGWANVLLLDATVREGIASGVTRFRFFCDEQTRDTINLAKRAGATPLGSGARFGRPAAERPTTG